VDKKQDGDAKALRGLQIGAIVPEMLSWDARTRRSENGAKPQELIDGKLL
jgi:hypothetical protein